VRAALARVVHDRSGAAGHEQNAVRTIDMGVFIAGARYCGPKATGHRNNRVKAH
jgi:hypothetical protein